MSITLASFHQPAFSRQPATARARMPSAAGRFLVGFFDVIEACTPGAAPRQSGRQMARELSSHSDRELADMGFSRADLPAIARGTYRR